MLQSSRFNSAATVIEMSATMSNVADTTEQLAELVNKLNKIVNEYKFNKKGVAKITGGSFFYSKL